MEILTRVGHHGQLLHAGLRRCWPDTARGFIKTFRLRQGFYYKMWPWASPKCTNNSHVFKSSLWGPRCSRQQDSQGTVVTMSLLGVFSSQESIPACVPWRWNSLLGPGSSVRCMLWGWCASGELRLVAWFWGCPVQDQELVLVGPFQVGIFCDPVRHCLVLGVCTLSSSPAWLPKPMVRWIRGLHHPSFSVWILRGGGRTPVSAPPNVCDPCRAQDTLLDWMPVHILAGVVWFLWWNYIQE